MRTIIVLRYITSSIFAVGFFLNTAAQEVSIEDPVEDPKLKELIYQYGYKGWYNVDKNIDYDTAEYYLKKALELQYSITYKIDDRVANNHIALASVYRKIYDTKKALENLDKAEMILMESNPEHPLFGNIYNNKGVLISSTNDVYLTKQYYEYALDFLKRIGYGDSENYYHISSNYIKLLIELKEYELAEEQLSKIDLKSVKLNPFVEYRFNLINASSFSKLGLYEQAISQFEQAYRILQSKEIKADNLSAMIYYYDLIEFYIQYDEYEKAHNVISQAFSYIESLNPKAVKNQTIYYIEIQYRKASLLFFEGNYRKALNLANLSISSITSFFENLSLNESVFGVRSANASKLPEFQILRSKCLYQIYLNEPHNDLLFNTYESYQEAITTLNSLKLSLQNEDSKLFATSQILEVYNEAIYIGMLLYKKLGDLQYLDKSFEFTESSKSFALFSEIKDLEAMEFSDLPASIKEKEKRFIGEIQAYEELLYKTQLSSEPDSMQVVYYKDKLFHLRDDYNDLIQEIEVNNARYFELKYNPKFVSLEGVQDELPYRDALIEYVLTDTMLITYVIDRKNIHVFSQEIGPEFAGECLEYYQLLHTQNFSSGVHDNYRRFVSLGRKFYKVLIEPCLQYTDRKSLTIVPDGAISYLPFEGLLTKDTDTEYINYLDLPYMIRDYSVGYSHSSTLMFSDRLKTKSPERKVLAFAPEYFDPLDNTKSELIRQSVLESDYLLPLDGIIKEVQSINETVPSRVFLNEQATEANFKKYASDYNVLHLAMHTIMRDDEPLYSHLAFTNVGPKDTIEDNKLYAYEIYNMKLNAQMAVLSSCSSGFGKMQKGEGMMSLARGFIYAGCPSIIMTLWQVSDQSSSELMTSFYRYLKKGKSKQESMRLAKIDFLDAADDLTSNPYFWSGFVVVGDGSPIYRKSGIAYWMIIITVFIGVIVFFQYRRS